MADYDPEGEGAVTDFRARMSYGEYLRLDLILDAQRSLTDAHDEMLFIVQHQTSELWMRLAIHEIAAARGRIAEDDVAPAMKMLARVSRIFEQLNNAWDVLRNPSRGARAVSQGGRQRPAEAPVSALIGLQTRNLAGPSRLRRRKPQASGDRPCSRSRTVSPSSPARIPASAGLSRWSLPARAPTSL